MTKNSHYSATRDQMTRTWCGWVQFPDGQIVETPQRFGTKQEALAAIHDQHPPEEDRKFLAQQNAQMRYWQEGCK